MSYLVKQNNKIKKYYSLQSLRRTSKSKILTYWLIFLFTSITLLSFMNGEIKTNPVTSQNISVTNSIKSAPVNSSSKSTPTTRNPYVGIGVITTPWKKDDCYKRAFLVQIYISNISQYENEKKITPNLIIWEYYDFNGDYHIEYNASKISIGREYEDRTELFFKITMFLDEDLGICKFSLRKTYIIHISGSSGYNPRNYPSANNLPSDNNQPKISVTGISDLYSNYISLPKDFIKFIVKMSNYIRKKLKKSKDDKKQSNNEQKSRFERFSPYI